MNTAALKGKIRANGKAQSDVAKEIGLSLSRFNAKLNCKDGAEFNLGEIKSLRNVLNLGMEETEVIFFS